MQLTQSLTTGELLQEISSESAKVDTETTRRVLESTTAASSKFQDNEVVPVILKPSIATKDSTKEITEKIENNVDSAPTKTTEDVTTLISSTDPSVSDKSTTESEIKQIEDDPFNDTRIQKPVLSTDKDKSVNVSTLSTSQPTTAKSTFVSTKQTSDSIAETTSKQDLATESTTFSTEKTTTTTEASFFNSGILTRVRDLSIALIAGLVAQSVGLPFSTSSSKKDDKEGVLLPNIPTKPPQVFTAKDPFVRNRIKGGEGAFDGNFFNLTIPIKPEEVNDLKRDQIKQNITKAVQEAFGNDQTSEDITVILPELSENDGKIFIKAPYVPAIKSSETPDATTTSIRPKLPRLDDNLEKQPIIKSTTRPTLQITTKDKPEFRVDPTFDRTTSVFRETTSTSTTLATPRTTSNIAQIKTTSRSSVSFELEDAITEPSIQPTISTTESFKRTGKPISSTYPTFASTRDSVSSVLPFEPSRRQPPTFIDPEFEPEYDPAIDPVLSRDEDEPIFDYLPIDENRIPIITPTVFVPKIPRR